MKVYIGVVAGKEPKIIGVWNDKHEAEAFSALYGVANGVWTNVIEQIVIEGTDRKHDQNL